MKIKLFSFMLILSIFMSGFTSCDFILKGQEKIKKKTVDTQIKKYEESISYLEANRNELSKSMLDKKFEECTDRKKRLMENYDDYSKNQKKKIRKLNRRFEWLKIKTDPIEYVEDF